MIDFTKFATDEFPLRASRLERFIACPWRVVMLTFGALDPAGEAADTGSATHRAVSHWHETGDMAAAVEVMRARFAEYPAADLQTAAGLFLAYTGDPRNQSVELTLNEQELKFTLEAEGTPIVIFGRPDQVRRENGVLRLWDLKTSKKQPHEVLWGASTQAAAYCKGAAVLLGEPVHPGGIIMPRRSPQHYEFGFTIDDIDRLLYPLIHLVTLVRKGIVWHNPEGDRCKWCHTGGPEACLPQLRYALPTI